MMAPITCGSSGCGFLEQGATDLVEVEHGFILFDDAKRDAVGTAFHQRDEIHVGADELVRLKLQLGQR